MSLNFTTLHRSYHLKFTKENNIAGVDTFDFELPKETFYNRALTGYDFLGNGVMSISKCYGGRNLREYPTHIFKFQQCDLLRSSCLHIDATFSRCRR